ncbi:MAG TPA: YwiC-like family protein [Candidatus Deferrimicrobiaceae bacterium]|nr:YwiC-like family protein [Candidatus Deferrimicrobiaceae bacterium]
MSERSTAGPLSTPSGSRAERIRWVPRQYGAWAILAVPLLLGVAASRPSPWHLVLAVSAGSAYLASVAALEWARARRTAALRPAGLFGAVLAVSGAALLVVEPRLLTIAALVVAVGGVTLAMSLAGYHKSVFVSLLEIGQALALVPAAALLAGDPLGPAVADAVLAGGLYLVGSVLVVRSLIRERGNRVFAVAALAYHGAVVAVAWLLLPWPYSVLAVALLARSAALLVAQARWRAGPGGPGRLRPVHIGIIEILASLALVTLGFTVGF